MEINALRQIRLPTRWDYDEGDPNFLIEHQHKPEQVCEHFRPHLVLNIHDHYRLHEATYKEIATLIDGSFLAQKVRADQLNGIFYRGFDDNTMMFEVNSSEFNKNRIRYRNLIQFDDWDEVGQDPEYETANERARMLLWAGNVKLHCTCPSFLYWGYQYLLSVLDSAIYPEQRAPRVRNPRDRGIVCKHLNRVLRVLPFYNGDIAQEIKNQFGA